MLEFPIQRNDCAQFHAWLIQFEGIIQHGQIKFYEEVLSVASDKNSLDNGSGTK